MQVFIAYTEKSLIGDLTRTLYAWDRVQKSEPVAIQVPEKKYELIRRVTAENMSEGDYILADIGCVPNSELVVKEISAILEGDEKVGMIQFSPEGAVRACRKGIIEKWPQNKSGLYQQEHEQAYLTEGYKVSKWPSLRYRRLDVH